MLRRMGGHKVGVHRLQRDFGLSHGAQWNFLYRRDRMPTPEFVTRLNRALTALLIKSVKADLAKLEIEALKQEDGNVDPDLASLRAEAQDILARLQAATER